MGTNIVKYLKDKYKIMDPQPIAHIHIEEPVTGMSLSAGVAQKLDLENTLKHVDVIGGWEYDNVLSCFIWGIDFDFIPVFAGTASVKMTTGTTPKLTFILRIGAVDILSTPVSFSTIDKIQQLAAFDLVKDGEPYVKLNDEITIWAESDLDATFSIEAFGVGLLGR